MMQSSNHILSKEGILTTFSISKRIPKKDALRIQKNFKLNKTVGIKLQKLLQKTIIEETHKAFIDKKIPGLIVSEQKIPDQEKKLMMELTYFASIIAKKMNEKKIDEFYSCYVINAIVNILGLDEKAFDDFHKKFSKYKDGGSGPIEPMDV